LNCTRPSFVYVLGLLKHWGEVFISSKKFQNESLYAFCVTDKHVQHVGLDKLNLLFFRIGYWESVHKPESWDSSVGIETGLQNGRMLNGIRFPHGRQIFIFSTAFVPVLGPTESPKQWVVAAAE